MLAFGRIDGAILGWIEIALAKAETSVRFNGPSENLWEFCKPGGPARPPAPIEAPSTLGPLPAHLAGLAQAGAGGPP